MNPELKAQGSGHGAQGKSPIEPLTLNFELMAQGKSHNDL